MTDVAKHEASVVGPTWRERCEAGDPGPCEQTRQEVGAFVQNHARKDKEIEGHTPQDTPATETRNPHQASHRIRPGGV
jgi:hypothetical protein